MLRCVGIIISYFLEQLLRFIRLPRRYPIRLPDHIFVKLSSFFQTVSNVLMSHLLFFL